jgi:hypothetical protein
VAGSDALVAPVLGSGTRVAASVGALLPIPGAFTTEVKGALAHADMINTPSKMNVLKYWNFFLVFIPTPLILQHLLRKRVTLRK